MTSITKADFVYVSTSKNADYVEAVPHEGAVKFIRADLHDATKEKLAKAMEALRACRATFIRCQWDEKSVAVESIDAVLAEIEKGGV